MGGFAHASLSVSDIICAGLTIFVQHPAVTVQFNDDLAMSL